LKQEHAEQLAVVCNRLRTIHHILAAIADAARALTQTNNAGRVAVMTAKLTHTTVAELAKLTLAPRLQRRLPPRRHLPQRLRPLRPRHGHARE